jgi:hypothetical protein
VIPKEYIRSDDYRAQFFRNATPAVREKYRCAYCGRKLVYQDTTVDHIFPINKLCYSEKVRERAKKFGIYEANDPRNLCAACRHCNAKKGTRMGLWIWRGLLGRSEGLWRFRKAVRVAVIVGACALAVYRVYSVIAF